MLKQVQHDSYLFLGIKMIKAMVPTNAKNAP